MKTSHTFFFLENVFKFTSKFNSKEGSKEGSKTLGEHNCTLVASCHAPSTDALESSCEFSSCM